MEYDLDAAHVSREQRLIADIAFNEMAVNAGQVDRVAGQKAVDHYDLVTFVAQSRCKIGADEPGTASNESFQNE
jgi:hypothetical protein